MNLNIFTTGGKGFLGQIITKQLNTSYKVFELQDFSHSRVDISKPFSIPGDLEVDIVIHMAGKAHSIPKNLLEEREFFNVNFQGTINLCNAIENLSRKPKAFIFVSTVAVYGLKEGQHITELQPLCGSTPYSKSKIQAEQFLTKWCDANLMKLSILRLPLVAGPNAPGNLRAMINGIKTGRYLSIGNANAKKSVVWAEDIARIVPRLAEIGGTYNLTDGDHPSFGDLESVISSALRKPKPFRIPMFFAKGIGKVGDLLGNKAPINSDKLGKITSTLTFDDSKARQNLRWNPTKVIDKIPEIV